MTLSTLAVNANNDLYLDASGNLAILTDVDALQQVIEQSCKVQLGELAFAADEGIPFFQAAWAGVPNIPQFSAALTTTILGIAGVTSLESLDVSAADGVLSYTAVISTIYSPVSVDGDLPIS